MRPLTDREKRTIRIAGAIIGIYLVLFFAIQGWKALERRRAAYARLVREAVQLEERLKVYADKATAAGDLMEQFRFDPAKLSRTTIVAQATAAIHKSALSGGIQLGPVRESPARSAARELTAIQMEGTGPVPGILSFLQGIERLGFPLIIDSLQFTPETRQPGRVKMNVTMVILDFEQWPTSEPLRPNA